jgi:hypothetical protein
MGDCLTPIDRKLVSPPETPNPIDAEPVIARRQGQGRARHHVEWFVDRFVARLWQYLHEQCRAAVGQGDPAEPPL